MTSALAPHVLRAFYGKFKDLRPAQAAAIEPILSGRDVVVLAGTGSGKTEAVLAPLVQRHLAKPSPLAVVYLCPTRALANDLVRRLEPPLRSLSLTVGVRHGERDDLRKKDLPDVVITTPESLDVLLWQHNQALAGVRAVVLDEAHLLYNSQRGTQTAVLLERLCKVVSVDDLQVSAMSATVSSVSDLWSFFRPGHSAIEVRSDERRSIDLVIRVGQSRADLASLLASMIDDRKALVFANSRGECDRLSDAIRSNAKLTDLLYAHHASLSKESRLLAEQEFARRRSSICVSTSTLELGIDIGDIDLVGLWAPPSGWPSYLQRIGRGNRRDDRCQVLGVVTEAGDEALWPTLCFEALQAQVDNHRMDAPTALPLFGALAQQISVGIEADGGGYKRRRELFDALSFLGYVGEQDIDGLVDGLVDNRVLTDHPNLRRVGAGPELHRLRDLLMIWSNFPLRSMDLDIVGPEGDLGTIPGTNLMLLRPGAVFVLGRDRLRVESTTRGRFVVRPTRDPVTTQVRYGGLPAPLDPGLVDEIRMYIEADGSFSHVDKEPARRGLIELARPLRGVVSDDRIPRCHASGGDLYATFGGMRLNRVIARRCGGDPDESDEIFVKLPAKAGWSELPATLDDLVDREVASDVVADLTIYQQYLPHSLLTREAEASFVSHPRTKAVLERLRQSVPVDVEWPTVRPLRLGGSGPK